MQTTDTFEVWICRILTDLPEKVWGGEDDVIAVQAWHNARQKYHDSNVSGVDLVFNRQDIDVL